MNISQPKPRSEKFDYDNDDDDNYDDDNNNNNNNNKLNFVTAALAVNRRFLFLKNWVQFHSSSCEICRDKVALAVVIMPVFQYHSTIAPYPHSLHHLPSKL